jgi:hypothetical protein
VLTITKAPFIGIITAYPEQNEIIMLLQAVFRERGMTTVEEEQQRARITLSNR